MQNGVCMTKKQQFSKSEIQEIVLEVLWPKSGFLARLRSLSQWLKTTNNEELKQEVLDKMETINESYNFYQRYRTTEGAILKVLDDLYKRFPVDLPKRLDKIAVSLDFNKILADKKAYARLMCFYNETMNSNAT